jgi:hypothetical protein
MLLTGTSHVQVLLVKEEQNAQIGKISVTMGEYPLPWEKFIFRKGHPVRDDNRSSYTTITST